ncbi:MAG: ACT domain-containing protein [Candidatus Omnitrophica bacterium]|nr:ACT domain-containing protein [Candidatus Omnitrophota bacterium]
MKQVSVFLENRLGRLSELTSLLAKNSINIRALALADKADYGILRLIVNDTERTVEILRQESFSVNVTPVLAVEVEDRPGGLAEILGILVENSINVEYMYAFVEKSGGKAVVVLRVEDMEKAERVLTYSGKNLLSQQQVENL